MGQMLYEKATGIEFGGEYLSETFKATIFKSCISAIVSCSWMATILIWNMEGDDESLAWGWGSVAFTSVLASFAVLFNFYYSWAPDGDAGEGGGWWGGGDEEKQPINDDRRGSNMSNMDSAVSGCESSKPGGWWGFGGKKKDDKSKMGKED